MKNQSFEQFLEEYWYENEAEGQAKEESVEACEKWIENLEVGDIIPLADRFADKREMQVRKEFETQV